MAITNLVWGPGSFLGGAPTATLSESDQDLDDADDKIAFTFMVPYDGTIDRVGFSINVLNGSPPDYYVGLQTLDASGNPSGANYGGSAPATFSPPGVGWAWVSLATAATATAGDIVAAVIYPTASAPDAGNSIDILNNVQEMQQLPHKQEFSTAWHAPTFGFPPMAVRYDDGTVYGIATNNLTMTPFYDDNDDPDEYGCKFTVPLDMTVYGVQPPFQYLYGDASCDVKLYDSTSTLLATATVTDEDLLSRSGTTKGFMSLFFDDPVELTAGNTYYIGVHATHATARVGLIMFDFPDADSRAFFPEGADWIYVTRNNGGAWTEDADRLIPFNLLANAYTVPTGDGGLVETGYVG